MRGELTLVLAPLGAEAREAREAARQLSLTEQVDAALRARLAAGEPVSSTAKQVAVELGVPKKAVYARALQISKASPEAAAGDANGPEGIEGVHFSNGVPREVRSESFAVCSAYFFLPIAFSGSLYIIPCVLLYSL